MRTAAERRATMGYKLADRESVRCPAAVAPGDFGDFSGQNDRITLGVGARPAPSITH
jgi:hypothetical protein